MNDWVLARRPSTSFPVATPSLPPPSRRFQESAASLATNNTPPTTSSPSCQPRLSLRLKTLKEKGLAQSLKKAAKESKKRKKREEADDAPALVRVNDQKEANNINNSSTAALTAKVLQEQEAKKRRMHNDNLKTLFSSRDQSKPTGKSADFMTRGYDIPAGAKR